MPRWKCVRNVFVCGFRMHSRSCDPRHGEEVEEKIFCGNEAKEWVEKRLRMWFCFTFSWGRVDMDTVPGIVEHPRRFRLGLPCLAAHCSSHLQPYRQCSVPLSQLAKGLADAIVARPRPFGHAAPLLPAQPLARLGPHPETHPTLTHSSSSTTPCMAATVLLTLLSPLLWVV